MHVHAQSPSLKGHDPMELDPEELQRLLSQTSAEWYARQTNLSPPKETLQNADALGDGINVIVQKSIEARIQGILQC